MDMKDMNKNRFYPRAVCNSKRKIKTIEIKIEGLLRHWVSNLGYRLQTPTVSLTNLISQPHLYRVLALNTH